MPPRRRIDLELKELERTVAYVRDERIPSAERRLAMHRSNLVRLEAKLTDLRREAEVLAR